MKPRNTGGSFAGSGGNAHRKACLLVRQDFEAGSAYADAALHGDGLTSLQYREAPGARTYEIQANVSAPRWLRIEKRGLYVSMSLSADGQSWQPAGGSFRLPVKGGQPQVIDTGFATRCNNDHGLSPDGTQLVSASLPGRPVDCVSVV